MYSQLHTEIIRSRQQEIAARAAQAHHLHDATSDSPSPRRNRTRVRRAVATVGVCLVAGTGIAVSDAGARTSGKVAAARFTREVRALEARGYVATSCLVDGALQLRSARTGRLMTVRA